MRALLQRVTHANVTADNQIVGQIDQGLLVLFGIGQDDGEAQVKALIKLSISASLSTMK
jgi:D-aminoacyl-tRNA deacylase